MAMVVSWVIWNILKHILHIDGLVQERRNSIAKMLTHCLELQLSCTNPLIYECLLRGCWYHKSTLWLLKIWFWQIAVTVFKLVHFNVIINLWYHYICSPFWKPVIWKEFSWEFVPINDWYKLYKHMWLYWIIESRLMICTIACSHFMGH